ncbi:predicted protein [Nematostella vectensis]|uniref:G-protein coupled receptors family 1 profile domain-containing protein n=1 Tax=Nematostella vectensis TaxID=45351 RepID=A7SN95_NEMVE|nr:predicted protein [Nematostella vectensis]|eukprot:XP_001626895.1 predicted protein [Nematostella vectensis]
MTLVDLILWCSAFGLIAIAITIGNSITIAVFTRKKLLRSRANYFLISLACADLMVGVVTLPLYLCTLVFYWRNGEATPSHVFFTYMAVDIFSGFASIFALTVIAIERLFAVLWPLKHRVASDQLYYSLVGLTWALSATISLFYYLFAYQVLLIKVFFYLVIFFIFSSLTVICIAYALIWLRLKVKMPHGGKHSRQSSVSRYGNEVEKEDVRRRVDQDILLTTLCIVTLVFVVTWVPFYILNIVVFFHDGKMEVAPNGFYFSKLLHYSNSYVNPIVYSIRIPKFSKTLSLFVHRKRQAFIESYRLLSSRYKSSSSSQSKSREIVERETSL